MFLRALKAKNTTGKCGTCLSCKGVLRGKIPLHPDVRGPHTLATGTSARMFRRGPSFPRLHGHTFKCTKRRRRVKTSQDETPARGITDPTQRVDVNNDLMRQRRNGSINTRVMSKTLMRGSRLNKPYSRFPKIIINS